jgi:nitrate reductase (NAD(P)H)
VIPPSANLATAESYFRRPEYTLYELNVNSVITSPGTRCYRGLSKKKKKNFDLLLHSCGEGPGEWLEISDVAKSYTMRGFAYAGGGRRVVRVEVSFDEGANWEECVIRYLEGVPRHGCKYWTWCHWEVRACRHSRNRSTFKKTVAQPQS